MFSTFVFFFNDTAPTEIYPLSLPDALPILQAAFCSNRRRLLRLAAGAAALPAVSRFAWAQAYPTRPVRIIVPLDRKSTRLNSSHSQISNAVFCLKKKKSATLSHGTRLTAPL